MIQTVLICDDSSLARKQLNRSLPKDWAVTVDLAEHGKDCLEKIAQKNYDLLFLDLNMPELDGYQVLEALSRSQSDAVPQVVVVSGDIQPKALERVRQLGAVEFLRKPASKSEIQHLLERQHWYLPGQAEKQVSQVSEVSTPLLDAYREICNVAMGQAGSLLAEVLNLFVKLPVPKVDILESSELHMALQAVKDIPSLSAVCQGFIGDGVSGEAFLLFDDTKFSSVGRLMGYTDEIDSALELEVLMDLSNILIGACLKGISDQLDINFSQGHPVVLGQHCRLEDLIAANRSQWQKTLAVEIGYELEGYDVQCDLLLLLTEESLPIINNKINYLLEGA